MTPRRPAFACNACSAPCVVYATEGLPQYLCLSCAATLSLVDHFGVDCDGPDALARVEAKPCPTNIRAEVRR